MTPQGVQRGLDERESISSQIAGIHDAIADDCVPLGMRKLTIVEVELHRMRRIREFVDNLLEERKHEVRSASHRGGVAPETRPHVFVAMPFAEGVMEAVYMKGIQPTLNSAGFLCESTDRVGFTGDIVGRIKGRIDTAALVIAEVSEANPNVCLEVGYAWGRGRQTLLISRPDVDLPFDMRRHKCLTYVDIRELTRKLMVELATVIKNLKNGDRMLHNNTLKPT